MSLTNADRALAAGEFSIALKLYEKTALDGDIQACAMVGYMLSYGPALFGVGIPCDRQCARCWLKMAADRGHMVAQMLIRQMDRLAILAPLTHGTRNRTAEEVEC
jgi:TPR repeat protein